MGVFCSLQDFLRVLYATKDSSFYLITYCVEFYNGVYWLILLFYLLSQYACEKGKDATYSLQKEAYHILVYIGLSMKEQMDVWRSTCIDFLIENQMR